MQYTITCTCGHTTTVQIYGPVADRERKAAWYAGRECPECYKARIEAERKAASEQAAEEAKASGLPALVGSPKQIAWAETIRANILDGIRKMSIRPEAIGAVMEVVAADTSAHDWIERRDMTATAYIRANAESIRARMA